MTKAWKGIIGHQKVIQFLEKSFQNQRLAHAYLFSGPPRLGKTKIAEHLAKGLICRQLKGLDFCGQCIECKQIIKRVHPDIVWISFLEGKSQINIEQIRQLKENLSLAPLVSEYKLAIIEPAETMTLSAANSFLKLLEETPKNTVIILITNNAESIFPTLRSRCQIVHFQPPNRQEIKKYLKDYFDLIPSRLQLILDLALNQPGLAIEMVSHPEKIKELETLVKEWIILLASDSLNNKIKLAHSLKDILDLDYLLQLIRQIILLKIDSKRKFPFQDINLIKESLEKVVESYSKERLVGLMDKIIETKTWLRRNVDFKLACENLLINF